MLARLFFLTFFTGSALADQTNSKLPSVDPISSAYLLKLTFGLVIIVVLIFALAWLMKKMQLTQNAQNGLINVISTLPVSHKEKIVLIEVGEEQILIGLTAGRIEKLHTLKQRLQVQSADLGNPSNFSDKFKQLLERGHEK